MPPSKKIILHLGKKNIIFDIVPHKKVFTAYDLAQTLGAKLEEIAKTLLVRVEFPAISKKGKQHFVIVLPASYRLDFDKLQKVLKANKVSLINEKGMDKLEITPGSLTPFGSLRGFGVIVDKALTKTKHVLVGAESFTESLRLKVQDLIALEQPLVTIIGKKNTALKVQAKPKQKKKIVSKKAKKTNKKKTKARAKKK